jgi:hypothetical protein
MWNVFQYVIMLIDCLKRDGTAESSFTSEMLEQPHGTDPEQEELIKWTAHVLYAGGIDTVCRHFIFIFVFASFI